MFSPRITAGCTLLVALSCTALRAGGQVSDQPAATTDVQDHQPNVRLQVSEDALNAGMASNTHTRAPFREMILGECYWGTSTTDARFRLRTEPAEDGIALTFLWQANVASRSHSSSRRTYVTSRSTTRITATKQVVRGQAGWHVEPATVTATSRSRVTGVKVRRLLGRRIARRRAYRGNPAVDRAVARRARQRTQRGFDRKVGELIESWQKGFDQQFRQPLAERDQLPELTILRSTDNFVELALLQGDGAPNTRSSASTAPLADLSLDLHESSCNNLATGTLAGQTVREDQLAEQMAELLGWQPEGLRPADPEKLWSVQFHREQPLGVEFHEGVVTVTLQAAGFTVGEKAFPGARLQLAYRLSVDDSGLTGSRLGRIAIKPLDAGDDSGKVGVRYQVFRSMLRRRFERLFPTGFTWARLPLPESWPQQATLYFSQCDTRDGWLQLACSLSPPRADKLARRDE